MSNRCPAKNLGDPMAGPMWNGWGVDVGNSRYQPAATLTVDQVPKLQLKWAFGFPNVASAYGQPTVAAGRVFVVSEDTETVRYFPDELPIGVDQLAMPLRPTDLDDLRWYFHARLARLKRSEERFDQAACAFSAPRSGVLYRAWLDRGDPVLEFDLVRTADNVASSPLSWAVPMLAIACAHRALTISGLGVLGAAQTAPGLEGTGRQVRL